MYQVTNVATVEDLTRHCNEMQPFLEAHYTADNPQAVLDRANALESYMALSGKLLADAKYRYNEVLHGVFIQAVKDGNSTRMQTSTLNKYIESLCKDYKYLVDWLDRINSSCVHQLDFSRTVLSKLKEEMRQLQYSGR